MWLKLLFLGLVSFKLIAAVPTEDGLLKNANNNDVQAKIIILRMMATSEDSLNKSIYLKLVFSLENTQQVSLLQMIYSGSQMLPNQLLFAKYFPSLLQQMKTENSKKKNLFYSTLEMLLMNRPEGMELFLSKSGIKINKGVENVNVEKVNLLKAYKQFLQSNPKGKEDNSPLNPQDPKQKEAILELFRANTYKRSENVSLIKKDNEFFWQVDWKNIFAYYSNEERQLRLIKDSTDGQDTKLEFNNYLLFNGINEFPKYILVESGQDNKIRIQTLGIESRLKMDKKPEEIFKEFKTVASTEENTLSTLLY